MSKIKGATPAPTPATAPDAVVEPTPTDHTEPLSPVLSDEEAVARLYVAEAAVAAVPQPVTAPEVILDDGAVRVVEGVVTTLKNRVTMPSGSLREDY
ncbi:MAG: hypothetical protein Q7V31_12085 [Parvibaculum sp.]|uniref:hypothetical protein n=1 Tax=Parvibaculum sp. TaxID=2024848 RepID=UPI00271FD3DB|nr:hypothetical protein [Parvibaculum sp.]MDO8839656.1 hypothetical protein [Parvibaculum sp.]